MLPADNEGLCVMSLDVESLATAGRPDTFSHEIAHYVDCHAAPGFAITNQPNRCPNGGPCVDPCTEDSTDEALPLIETIAQVIATGLLRDVGPYDFESCDVLADISGALQPPHTETCFDTTPPSIDVLSVLSRGPCADVRCDKPDGFDAYAGSMDPTGWCDRAHGYDVYSVMQPMWELMHARSCTPDEPYVCETVPLPAGVDPAVLAMDAFLYGVRTNPMTYQQLLDAVAVRVACEYGEQVYDAFNQIVCHHGWRACDAPMPTVCEDCGNGIREGGEQCDGSDFSGPDCADLQMTGELVGCDTSCMLVCMEEPAADETADGGGEAGGVTSSSSGAGSTGTGTETGGDDGSGGGCTCRHEGPVRGDRWPMLALAMLWVVRRREGGPCETN